MTLTFSACRDPYATDAGWTDLIRPRTSLSLAVETLLWRIRPASGPVLDIGAGTGTSLLSILERVPTATGLALEPSHAMRSLLLSKISSRLGLSGRLTVRPEDFFAAELPPRISAALLLDVLGHFDPGERAAIFAELAARLPAGGAAVLSLPKPRSPTRIRARERTIATVGELSYRCIAEGDPVDGDALASDVSDGGR